jgi:hypothetical protein
MFITFFERFSSPSSEEFFDYAVNEYVDPSEKLSKNITKAFYKLNRSINKVDLPRAMRDIKIEGVLKVSVQIEIIKNCLSLGTLCEDHKKAIRAILLFCETMPSEDEKDCCDDAYLILLLPHLDEIISNHYLHPIEYYNQTHVPFETLRKMFMVRLSLGFGKWSKKDISADNLSLLARQNNLKSIQNAVSKKELYALGGKGPSQRIDSQSARNWLTEKIKNRLIHFSWAEDGPALNSRSELRYLNYFKIKYFQILCDDDLEQLEDCPDRGCYQLIVRDIESMRKIYHGYCEKNLGNRLKFHFKKKFNEASSNINSDNYSDPKFHLLVFESKQEGRNGAADEINLESLFRRTAEPHKRYQF